MRDSCATYAHPEVENPDTTLVYHWLEDDGNLGEVATIAEMVYVMPAPVVAAPVTAEQAAS